MEKFSLKEKIALAIFGLILLAIIVQVVVRINSSKPGKPGIAPEEDVQLDLAANLLKAPGVTMTVSSQNTANQNPAKLLDNKPATFWHVDLDKVGEPAWVMVDFGENGKKTVRSLGAVPREDIPRQFFRDAELRGSNDGETWETVSAITQDRQPRSATWREWKFENDRPFRYYKLLITDGHEDGQNFIFYSMSELALFE